MAVKLTNEIKSICNTYRPIYGYDYHIRDNGDEFTEKSRSARRWFLNCLLILWIISVIYYIEKVSHRYDGPWGVIKPKIRASN